jgi:hypothetical protein
MVASALLLLVTGLVAGDAHIHNIKGDEVAYLRGEIHTCSM